MPRHRNPPPAAAALTAKALRWMDLTTLLAARRQPATRDEIFLRIAAYGMEQQMAASDHVVAPATARESARRKFERDKDELRTRGLSIETVRIAGGGNMTGQIGYVLRPGSERPLTVDISGGGDGAGPPLPGTWRVTEAELSVVDACLARLVVSRKHPLQGPAESARRGIGAGGDPELGGQGSIRLMPQEQLAVQVALVLDPRGTRLAGHLAAALRAVPV